MKKKKLPYFPFYPSDFDSDTDLLSDAEVGAYIRLLNIQWKSGKIPEKKLPRLMEDHENVWPEIEQYFDCEDGLVFNSRLERERGVAEERHNTAVARGKAGADARWNTPSNRPSIDGALDGAIATQNSELITKKLRTTEHKKRVETLFLAFYSDYPKKVGKAQAQKAFHKISPDDDLFNVIITALKNHIRKWDDPKYIPHPATWLNQKRWEDSLEVPTIKPDSKEVIPIHSCSLCSEKFQADMNTYLEFGGMCPACRKTNTITAVK